MLFMGCPKQFDRRYLLVFVLTLWAITLRGTTFSPPDSAVSARPTLPSPPDAEFVSVAGEMINAKLLHSTTRHIGLDYRPEYVLPTNQFVRGKNSTGQRIDFSQSLQLRYAFAFAPGTLCNSVYNGVYQGVGLAVHSFNQPRYLGTPVSLYLFQGARLFSMSRSVSFNYEWDFGLSFGWKPYNYNTNRYNSAIGSRTNAYMNLNFYVDYKLSPQLNLVSGVSVTHFSNGNTKFPNSGLNSLGMRVGLVYNFEHKKEDPDRLLYRHAIPPFPRHISYDCVLFGSWRKKGVTVGEEEIAAPDAYPVFGFNFAPMYNLSYMLRTGVSLDGVYDGSANIYASTNYDDRKDVTPDFLKPSLDKQLALGVSARVELVMPYFRVNLGMGTNLTGKGDQRGTYQVLVLKIEVMKNSFLHIGYNLQDFHTPNYLMLGLGYRFHDKYPTIHRK